MYLLRRAGVLAGVLLALACALPALAAAAITVRVEGEQQTLLPRTVLTLGAYPDAPGCGRTGSALAAFDAAVGGDYTTASSGVITTIKGETHDFSRSDYWAFWIGRGGRYVRANAPCDEILADRDEVLVFPDFSPPPDFSPTVFPLAIEGVPATVTAGQSFTVTVVEYRTTTQFGAPGEGERTPRPGATVTLGTSTVTTGADGRATLIAGAAGPVSVRATRQGNAPSAPAVIAVTAVDAPAAPRGATTPPCVTTGDDGRCGTRDRRAPQARITGIEDGARFRRSRAPRRLRGTVAADPSGIRAVRLRLTRRHDGRCSTWAAARERFVRARCGTGRFFDAGAQARWSYLLPERLPQGRYVLDVVAIDNASNRDRIRKGRSRVRFTVR